MECCAQGGLWGIYPLMGFFFFSLKRLKTYLKNTTGQLLLNRLLLMNIHRDIPLCREKNIDEFSVKKARRVNFRLD
jgi:hypothetical protein